jgi:uncharacterized MAPEG superfamily protein
METAFFYVALSSMLCVLLWLPYIGARAFVVWGLPTFLRNYPDGFPAREPEPPLWAVRAQRAHLNMVETLPAFIGVVLAASVLLDASETARTVGGLCAIFFWARVAHAVVYALGLPFLRTPVYLLSWVVILAIGALAVSS